MQSTPTLLDVQSAMWGPYQQALQELHAQPSFGNVQQTQLARAELVSVLSLPETAQLTVESTDRGVRVVVS